MATRTTGVKLRDIGYLLYLWRSAIQSSSQSTPPQTIPTHIPTSPPIWRINISSILCISTYQQVTDTNARTPLSDTENSIPRERASLMMYKGHGLPSPQCMKRPPTPIPTLGLLSISPQLLIYLTKIQTTLLLALSSTSSSCPYTNTIDHTHLILISSIINPVANLRQNIKICEKVENQVHGFTSRQKI